MLAGDVEVALTTMVDVPYTTSWIGLKVRLEAAEVTLKERAPELPPKLASPLYTARKVCVPAASDVVLKLVVPGFAETFRVVCCRSDLVEAGILAEVGSVKISIGSSATLNVICCPL